MSVAACTGFEIFYDIASVIICFMSRLKHARFHCLSRMRKESFITYYISDKSMKLDAEDAVTRVLKLGNEVRVVSICDMEGKLVFSARHKATKNLLSPSESKESLEISARNMTGRKKLARKLGKCRYTLAEYTKVKRLVMPAGKRHLIFVTCSTDYDHGKIIELVETF